MTHDHPVVIMGDDSGWLQPRSLTIWFGFDVCVPDFDPETVQLHSRS